jgi:hypothetical protein
MVVMLGRIVIDLAQRPVVVKVRIPAGREVHSPIEAVRTGAQPKPLQPANHDIRETFHA